MRNALTIDVEDYFHVHAFETVVSRRQWDHYPRRVAESTRRFLGLCDRHDTRATFFVLGWVAEREPSLIRDIAAEGHEIASHGFWHEAVYRQTEQEFGHDLELSREAIGKAAPRVSLRGYRAPSFSITPDQPWAFETLRRAGFDYDSSVFPVKVHDRYGCPSAPRTAHTVGPGLVEVPLSTVRVLNQNLPIAGGGYLRLYPSCLTHWGIRRINREGHPAIIYLHPWELDPDQPRISGASLKSRFRHYVNLHKTESRLERLLSSFSFGPISEVFADRLPQGSATGRTV